MTLVEKVREPSKAVAVCSVDLRPSFQFAPKRFRDDELVSILFSKKRLGALKGRIAPQQKIAGPLVDSGFGDPLVFGQNLQGNAPIVVFERISIKYCWL